MLFQTGRIWPIHKNGANPKAFRNTGTEVRGKFKKSIQFNGGTKKQNFLKGAQRDGCCETRTIIDI